ncbi:MAG TPA: glycosyltransferase, partial [Pyrinomonadaceae bacterium]|nr:glycosyltransferase [Pyrinomonadaceae bacterium]
DRRVMKGRTWKLESLQLLRNGKLNRDWLIESVKSRAFEKAYKAGARTGAIGARAYIKGFKRLTSMAEAQPADWFIAHAHGALPIARAAARRWNARLGFDCEDLLAEMGGDPPEIIEQLERENLPACDYISVPSQSIGERLRERYNIKPPVVLYNVFPRELADGMIEPKDRSNARPLRLHWFGQTIGEGRGLEEAIEAIRLIDWEVELHLRGRVSDEYRARLESLAGEDSRHQIIFHRLIAHDQLIRSLEEFDVGLALERPENGSYARTVSNKLFAYLLGGLAIAVSDTPGQREVLERIPDAGFLYEAGNAESLAKGLQRWLGDRDALRRAQQAAWEAAREKFCWDIEKEKFLNLLEPSTLGRLTQTA